MLVVLRVLFRGFKRGRAFGRRARAAGFVEVIWGF